jgi:hypothetical protein
MQAGVAVRDEKPSREPGVGHEPIRVAEADVRGTCPDLALVAHDILNCLQA